MAEIKELLSLPTVGDGTDETDAEFVTNFISNSFSSRIVGPSCSSIEKYTPNGNDKAVKNDGKWREYKFEVTKTYLTKEAHQSKVPGFLVDIGAPKSVIGKKKLKYLSCTAGTNHVSLLRKSYNRFRFANETFDSIGMLTLFLDTPTGIPPMPVEIDIVIADFPPLLGLDVLDREKLIPDIAYNVLAKRHRAKTEKNETVYIEDWCVPMWRSPSRHCYVSMGLDFDTNFTRAQLHKLHLQLHHPSAGKLYNLLRRSRPEDTTPETKRILKELTKRCVPCQKIQPGPTNFRVTLGARSVRFNERVLMDIMYIGKTLVLHIVEGRVGWEGCVRGGEVR